MAMTDRERVVNRLKKLIKAAHDENYDFIYIPVGTAKLIVKMLEDQEAVVRCRDCKYWEDSENCPVYDLERPEDWFCADGERR